MGVMRQLAWLLALNLCLLHGITGEETVAVKLEVQETANWLVNNCIMLNMDAKIEIEPDKEDKNSTFVMSIPKTANATGSCDSQYTGKNTTYQFINITWTEPEQENPGQVLSRNLEFYFEQNSTMTPAMYGVSRINARYDLKHYIKSENHTDPATNKTVITNSTEVEYVLMTSYQLAPMEFLTPINRSYICADIGQISLHSVRKNSPGSPGGDVKLENANLTAINVHLDAYRTEDSEKQIFQMAMDCSYRPSDIVPIIVGCALAGTVFAVLVAYLIGRRRSRARGYQSV